MKKTKEIKIIVDSTEENERIKYYVEEFVKDNFQKVKEAKITISDLDEE